MFNLILERYLTTGICKNYKKQYKSKIIVMIKVITIFYYLRKEIIMATVNQVLKSSYEASKINYTSRDYVNILDDLIASIPRYY